MGPEFERGEWEHITVDVFERDDDVFDQETDEDLVGEDPYSGEDN